MSATDPQVSDYTPRGRPLTGRKVLMMMLAFYALIITMNFGILLPNAISTFRGLETDSAYRVSQNFNGELAMAAQQAGRGWQVDARVEVDPSGERVAIVTANDRDGVPLTHLEGEALVAWPADRRRDHRAELIPVDLGRYEARFGLVEAGQWDLVLTFRQDGERVFHSRNRIMLD